MIFVVAIFNPSLDATFLWEETQVFSEELGVPQGACIGSAHLEVTLLRLVF